MDNTGMDNTDSDAPSSSPGRTRKLALAVGLIMAVPLGAMTWNATAGATSLVDDEPVPIAEDLDEVVEEGDGEIVDDCGAEPTAEDLAEWNAETDDLAAFLDERGLAYTIETDELGSRWVDYDYDDEAVSDAVDEFYAARYPMTEEEIAERNAEEDALAAYLDEQGVAYTADTDAYGVRLVEYDWEDEAVVTTVDEFYAAEYPLTADEVAELDAEADALAAAFDAAGIDYTVGTDAWGARFVEWDYEDEAANEVSDGVYEQLFPEDEVTCATLG